MSHHHVKLEPDEVLKLGKLKASIQYWESQVGRSRRAVQRCEAQLFGHYDAEGSMLNEFLVRLGVDTKKVEDVKIGKEGQIVVIMQDEEDIPPTPPTPPENSDSDATSPPAP